METKLTLQQLQFIDTYLKDSGVQYNDIRYEMTDHVGSALESMEGNFNSNFDIYVTSHKRELLKAQKKFTAFAVRKAVIALVKNLCSPWAVLLTSLITITGIYVHKFYERIDIANTMQDITHVIFFTIILSLLYKLIARKPVYSAVAMAASRLGIIIYIGFPLLRLQRLLRDSDFLFTYHAVIITLGIALLVTTFKLDKKYKLLYNGD